jgi:voltage-gated potassium channel
VFGADKKLKDHIIICGLGATALHIIEELESPRDKSNIKNHSASEMVFHDCLVIDSSQEAIENIKTKWPKIKYLVGDVTDDDVLEKANIKDAYGIFPVLSSEKDNLYITMAARHLNPRIRIVARTADVYNIGKKLFKGGASSVVSPNLMGGLRLVSEIARPHATDFLDELLHQLDTRLRIEELSLSRDSSLSGLTLKEAKLPKKCGMNILAIKKRGHLFYTYNPSASDMIEYGDTLVVLGHSDQIRKLKELAG